MANPLFERVSPAELANREEVIDFKGKVGDLERLSEIISADLAAVSESPSAKNWREAPVEIRLAFSWSERQAEVPAVTGHAAAAVTAICQRCLEAYQYRLETSIQWLVGAKDGTESDGQELGEFEEWELVGDTIRALDLAEESLLLAMPLAPMHEPGDSCAILKSPAEAGSPDTVRPFADLRSKMDKVET